MTNAAPLTLTLKGKKSATKNVSTHTANCTARPSLVPEMTYHGPVTDHAAIDMKVGPEGRVVIPAPIRRHLGVGPGDNLRFLLHADGTVEIVSPRVLAQALWANNTGGDAVDSAELVRELRREDQQSGERSADSQVAGQSPPEPERVLREMGLSE